MKIMTVRLLSLSSVLLLVACKSRDFNSDLRGRTDNPDRPADTCLETLNKNAPYTPETLNQQLTAAFNQAALSKTLTTEHFRDLLFSEEAELAGRGQLKNNLLLGDSCSLIRAINESMSKPSYFYWLTGNGRTTFGGMTMYKGDIYAEGFYRNRGAGVENAFAKRRVYDTKELFSLQPWFEWSPQTKKFSARLGSPAARLFQHIIEEQGTTAITLHRGTNVKYADKATALASRNSFSFGPNLGGIFSTPSFEVAKGWAGPVVLSARMTPKQLSEAATLRKPEIGDVPTVYAGVEFGYVEIAFVYSPGDKNNLFFDNIIGKCTVAEKAQPADANFAAACK